MKGHRLDWEKAGRSKGAAVMAADERRGLWHSPRHRGQLLSEELSIVCSDELEL